MLLLIALTLKGSIAISPTVLPKPPSSGGDGGSKFGYSNTYRDKNKEDRENREKILRDDSELVAIVELTLMNFII